MGLKPIMKSVGFLCPGIYITSNSLEAGTWAASAREEGASPIPCNQLGLRDNPFQPAQQAEYKGYFLLCPATLLPCV